MDGGSADHAGAVIARSRRPQAHTWGEFEAISFGVGSYSPLFRAARSPQAAEGT
jgi:hypothetical protein